MSPRLELNTVAKYRSFLDTQLLPQWKAWPLVAIFNGYVEIERWLSELHEDYAESSVSSYFALFSTILNGAVRARMIPANPCSGVRVSNGLYELGLGMSGFVLCLMDFYTGARWGELVGQQRHELKEVGGKVYKGGRKSDDHHSDGRQRPPTRRGNSRPKKERTKTPAGTRFVALPPGIAVLYEELDDAGAGERRSPILPTFTFHEGRHTHSTWLTEDGIPEVARRARLGQKMKGMARVYDHVTPAMVNEILDVLEERWLRSLASLYPGERAKLVSWFPHLWSRRAVPALGAVAI